MGNFKNIFSTVRRSQSLLNVYKEMTKVKNCRFFQKCVEVEQELNNFDLSFSVFEMPKKCGENSKAVAARARKEEAASTEKAKRAKEAEDALWADDDKHIAKKQVA